MVPVTTRIQFEAAREVVVYPREDVPQPYAVTEEGQEEWAIASRLSDNQQCLHCQAEGHWVRCRATPRPDPRNTSAIDELVESCPCCMFGPTGLPGRGLRARLEAERADGDDFDITIEVLDHNGRWFS